MSSRRPSPAQPHPQFPRGRTSPDHGRGTVAAWLTAPTPHPVGLRLPLRLGPRTHRPKLAAGGGAGKARQEGDPTSPPPPVGGSLKGPATLRPATRARPTGFLSPPSPSPYPPGTNPVRRLPSPPLPVLLLQTPGSLSLFYKAQSSPVPLPLPVPQQPNATDLLGLRSSLQHPASQP